MQQDNKEDWFIGTVIFHVAAVIIMFLFGFVTPLPLPEEEGILINLVSMMLVAEILKLGFHLQLL